MKFPSLRKGEQGLMIFTLSYVLGFIIFFFSAGNYEFVFYAGVVLFFFFLIGMNLRKLNFDYVTLWGLSIWGLLHMAGGGLRFNGEVLYALRVFPVIDVSQDFFILKFDQIVHFFGFGVAALVVFSLIEKIKRKESGYRMVYFLAILGSLGLGVLNEIVEFLAVVSLPRTGVGGYYNVALDLIFNLLGAVSAMVFVHVRRSNSPRKTGM